MTPYITGPGSLLAGGAFMLRMGACAVRVEFLVKYFRVYLFRVSSRFRF